MWQVRRPFSPDANSTTAHSPRYPVHQAFALPLLSAHAIESTYAIKLSKTLIALIKTFIVKSLIQLWILYIHYASDQ